MRHFTFFFSTPSLQNPARVLYFQPMSVWTGHIPSAQWPHVAGGYCTGWHRLGGTALQGPLLNHCILGLGME